MLLGGSVGMEGIILGGGSYGAHGASSRNRGHVRREGAWVSSRPHIVAPVQHRLPTVQGLRRLVCLLAVRANLASLLNGRLMVAVAVLHERGAALIACCARTKTPVASGGRCRNWDWAEIFCSRQVLEDTAAGLGAALMFGYWVCWRQLS